MASAGRAPRFFLWRVAFSLTALLVYRAPGEFGRSNWDHPALFNIPVLAVFCANGQIRCSSNAVSQRKRERERPSSSGCLLPVSPARSFVLRYSAALPPFAKPHPFAGLRADALPSCVAIDLSCPNPGHLCDYYLFFTRSADLSARSVSSSHPGYVLVVFVHISPTATNKLQKQTAKQTAPVLLCPLVLFYLKTEKQLCMMNEMDGGFCRNSHFCKLCDTDSTSIAYAYMAAGRVLDGLMQEA